MPFASAHFSSHLGMAAREMFRETATNSNNGENIQKGATQVLIQRFARRLGEGT